MFIVQKKAMGLPPVPISPTLERGAKLKKRKQSKELIVSPASRTVPLPHPTTPPRPPTPQRNQNNSTSVQLSPVRTPLSHKGLHMSPSASLAHYKSNLDPPPTVSFRPDDGIDPAVLGSENMRTPPRKRGRDHRRDRDKDGTTRAPPMTPKRLLFPAHSPLNESPFRTPGARSIFDPHDPAALLDEELSALGARMGGQESPAGLFGRRGLLYESPSVPSPGKWMKGS